MTPPAFTIGSTPIYWYGLMFSLAFMFCGVVWASLSHRRGYGASTGFEFGFWLILSSVFGARLAFIIANLSTYLDNPSLFLNLRSGGLIFYGGILGGLFMTILFARLKSMPVLGMLDIAAAGTPLGHSVGRLGCHLNECCYGIHDHGFGAVMTGGGLRVPVQLIESTGTLLIFLLLWRSFRTQAPWGRTAAQYLLFYGLLRFCTEWLRGDPRVEFGPLHVAQWISLGAVIVGGLWLVRLKQQNTQKADV